MELTCLFHFIPINCAEIIPHGDYLESCFLPFFSERRGLFRVAVVAFFIVRYQHEGCAAVRIAADRVHMHTHIAAAVSEGKHRLTPDVPYNLSHLIHLQVLDEQLIRTDHIVSGLEHVLKTILSMLPGRFDSYIHSDDILIRNVHYAFDKGPAQKTVAARNNKDLKVVFLQIFDDFHHGRIKGICIGHALKTVHIPDQAAVYEILKLFQRHPGIGAGCMCGVKHVHVIRERFIQGVISQHASEFKHFGIRTEGRILQDTPCQKIVFQICRAKLRAEGTIHVEHGDTVCRRNIIRGVFFRYCLYVFDQSVQRRSAVVPVSKDFLILIGFLCRGCACGKRVKSH